jgi:hypothetical protein
VRVSFVRTLGLCQPNIFIFTILHASNIRIYMTLRAATGYGLERGSIPGKGKNFLFSIASRNVVGPLIQCAPGVKWLEREAEHPPPSIS